MDDNGNRFEVSRHASQEAALRAAAELEAHGHKQLYSVRPTGREQRASRGSRGALEGERDEHSS
ncbi:MAG TPA: SPOR domain-containing protein [Alphaproteobacteria bacterium]|nr:SPOR domain-containing protein [Alphaproteobacteria bacterium]